MKALQGILLGLLILIFSTCSTGYKNEGDAVYYKHWNEGSGQHKDRIDADPKTFKILKFDNYAKDDKNVFYQGEPVYGADASTFEALDDLYARDKNKGYYCKDSVKASNGRTFRMINSYYSTDGLDVFYRTSPLNMADPENFRFVHGEGDYQSWTTDGKYYYYNRFKVPSEDYKNVIIFPEGGGLSKDKNWVYFDDHKLNYDDDGNKIVDTIDAASFIVTGYIRCKDKFGCFNVYRGRVECEE